eukprot:TRINITY_DN45633_c0_g1_i1.p1 TRINITY_DN45633_c0_g1~~TRINITY_DN45633_c0_g1_i1.p1  ORF type:complete len:222 (-),score=40.34 TRINITY_DN45633_c0_g1_i1:87-752(-)
MVAKSGSVSDASRKAVAEWDATYTCGQQPFGPSPFSKLDALLLDFTPDKAVIIDLGSGYGRDALFLAQKVAGCCITAIEPGEQGTLSLKNAAAELPDGLGANITAVCAFAEEYDFAACNNTCDMVLLDSVLAFLEPEAQSKLMPRILACLKEGGNLVILGWPNESDRKWVAKLIEQAGMTDIFIKKNAEEISTSAVFDGEETPMTWHVTVASRRTKTSADH